ncbi:hypothetical protein H4I96_01842 [Botrytis cinerea]
MTTDKLQVFKFGDGVWDPSHRFVTSWLVSPWALFAVRASISLYAFFVLLFAIFWEIAQLPNGGATARFSFSYFTILCYWGISFYFFFAALHTFTYARSGIPYSRAFRAPPGPARPLLQHHHLLPHPRHHRILGRHLPGLGPRRLVPHHLRRLVQHFRTRAQLALRPLRNLHPAHPVPALVSSPLAHRHPGLLSRIGIYHRGDETSICVLVFESKGCAAWHGGRVCIWDCGGHLFDFCGGEGCGEFEGVGDGNERGRRGKFAKVGELQIADVEMQRFEGKA